MISAAKQLNRNFDIKGPHPLSTGAIPDELKALRQWVNWKAKILDDGHITKIPINPVTGGPANTAEPATWSDFNEVIIRYKKGDTSGIGFVFTASDPYFGIDLDSCFEGDALSPWAGYIIEQIASYTEITQSGGGIHIIGRGSLPNSGRRKGSFEIYDQGRYFVMTGNVLRDDLKTIKSRQAEVEIIHAKIFGTKTEPELKKPVEICNLESFQDDRDLVERAQASRNGATFAKLWAGDFSDYPSQSEADQALCNHLAFWTQKDHSRINSLFQQSGLFREKWNKKHFSDGTTYGDATIRKAIESTRETYQAHYNGEDRKADAIEQEEKETSKGFPDIMSGAAGQFADLYGEYIEVPKPFLYLSFLACLGSVVSGALTLATELKPQPRLYLILLGASADDRKSTGINKAVEFFRDTLSTFNVCYGVGSAEGLQARIKDSEGSGTSCLLLVLDEFKQLISKCKIESSVLLPCINTLFESDHYESRTKKSEIVIRDAHLSLLAASTVDTYERTWDASFTDIGFNNRLFLVPGQGEKRFSLPEKVPEAKKVILKKQLFEILSFVGVGRELDITQHGRISYQDWYMNLEKSIHAKRLDTYALRFMTLLAANERKEVIDEEIVNKVTQLMDWQLEVRRLHDPIDADSAVAKVEEKIRRLLHTGGKSERDLKRAIHVERTGLWPFTQAINNLTGGHEIHWDKTQKKYFGE